MFKIDMPFLKVSLTSYCLPLQNCPADRVNLSLMTLDISEILPRAVLLDVSSISSLKCSPENVGLDHSACIYLMIAVPPLNYSD